MVKFCTNCGTKLEDEDSFCTNCGQKTYVFRKTKNVGRKEVNLAKQKLKKITGGFLPNPNYMKKLENNYITLVEGDNIKKQIEKEIESRTLLPEEVENRLDELIAEHGKSKNKVVDQKSKYIDEYLENEFMKNTIEKYHINKKTISKLKYNSMRKINAKNLKNISKNEIINFVEKELVDEFNTNKKYYLENLIKDTCPNLELTNIEKKYIQQIKLEGSVSVVESKLNILSEKIIDNRKKLGKIDAEAILIEDGGYKTKRPNLFSSKHEHLVKAESINTDVYMKFYEDRILLFECYISDYFSENSLGRKRTIFFNDIILMNKGYKERISRMGYDSGPFGDKILNRTGIELSFINNEKIKLAIDDKDKIEFLYNIWVKYKENKDNKIYSSSQESNRDVSEDILKYAELYEKGLLTEEEFTALKKKLLGL